MSAMLDPRVVPSADHATREGPIASGVAWVTDRWGNNFEVLHQFVQGEGHAASLLQAQDGFLYGCAVSPATSVPSGAPLPSGIWFRMAPSGSPFQVLYTFSQTDACGENTDGADCYEPLVETEPGVFYGAAYHGGTNGNGVVFRYSRRTPGVVDIVHDFSATTSSGANWDGAGPDGRLTPGRDGTLYSNAYNGGTNGNGVIYAFGLVAWFRHSGQYQTELGPIPVVCHGVLLLESVP